MKLSILLFAFASWTGSGTMPEKPADFAVAEFSFTNPAGSGVYKSAADYQAGKLSLAVDCRSETHKILLHRFSNKDYIDVIHQGKKHTMKKSEIFGIRDCEANKEYQILEETFVIFLLAMDSIEVANERGLATGSFGDKGHFLYHHGQRI
jgi:hypothetical protein